MSWHSYLVLAVTAWFPIAFAAGAVRTWTGASGPISVLRDRVDVLTGVAECLTALSFGWALGPWDVVPPAVWGLAVGVAAFGLLLGLRCLPALAPVRAGVSRPRRWAAAAADLAVTAGMITLVAG